MAAQLPEEEKIKAADYMIDNSARLEQTRAQVREAVGEVVTPQEQFSREDLTPAQRCHSAA